jgi:CRISPR/Cas system-associated exonuclease Cas4 (RecB family)
MPPERPAGNGESQKTADRTDAIAEKAVDSITASQFAEWRSERQFRRNIRNGRPYFNGPSSEPPPHRHSPSSLIQCHRKLRYREENAPEETEDSEGILWTGEQIEEKLIVPFLQDVVATESTYVRNSMWVDYTCTTKAGDLQIKGVTDPVIVDEESNPLLPTEVKTTSSLEYRDSPTPHHRAQLHAYLEGLSRKYGEQIREGIIIYLSRETLDLKPFRVGFDQDYWNETVMRWAESHTKFRLNGQLPPGEPEEDWECGFCAYQERCGKGQSSYSDLSAEGFVPGVSKYPREKVLDYLESSENRQLTPTLAKQYSELAQDYGVQSWRCPVCSEYTVPKNSVQQGRETGTPLCPYCAANDEIVELCPPNSPHSENLAHQNSNQW